MPDANGDPGISQAGDTTELLKSIVNWVVSLLGADGGEIYLYDAQKLHLRLAIACGSMERYYGATLSPGEGLAGKVFSSGVPQRVDDYQAWDGRAPKFEDQPPFQAEIAVPLRWHERTIGVLVIVADTQKHPVTDSDVKATHLCANLVAVAIENARLYRELQHSLNQFKFSLEQEIVDRTSEIARQTTLPGMDDVATSDFLTSLNTEQLLSHVLELRIAKMVLTGIARVSLETPSPQDLTPREVEVLKLIAQGLNNKEIASALSLAVSTVKFHVGSILGKLNLSDRTQAALWAVRMGLVKPASTDGAE